MGDLKKVLTHVHSFVEKKGNHVIHTSEISRFEREVLIRHHWLEEIIRGWYLFVRPDIQLGDSTVWYSSFWDFLHVYLEHHYEKEYCLSAECSIDFQIGSTVVPRQIIVLARGGSGTSIPLPHNTSLLVYSDPVRLPEEDRIEIRGMQVMSLEYALCKVSPSYFQNSQQDAEIALQSIRDPNAFLKVIAKNSFKSASGRIIGAYRFLGNNKMAEVLKSGLESIGIRVVECNPFVHHIT